MNLELVAYAVFLNLMVSVLLVMVIYLMDLYEKEPLSNLACSYMLGMAMAACLIWMWSTVLPGEGGTLSSDVWFVPNSDSGRLVAQEFWVAYVQAGMFEELAKLLPMLFVIWRWKSFNEPLDGIVFAAFVGAGFEVYENVVYTVAHTYQPYHQSRLGLDADAFSQALAGTMLIRSFPGHVLFGIVSGYFLGMARFQEPGLRRVLLVVVAFVIAMLLHGTHNLLAAVNAAELWRAFGLFLIGGCVVLVARAIRISPFRERFEEFRARLLIAASKAGKGEHGEAVRGLESQLRQLVHEARYCTVDDMDTLIAQVDHAMRLTAVESGERPAIEVLEAAETADTVDPAEATRRGRSRLLAVLDVLRKRRRQRQRSLLKAGIAFFVFGGLALCLLCALQLPLLFAGGPK